MSKLVSVFSIAATLAASTAFAADQSPKNPPQEPTSQSSGKMDHRKMAEEEFASLDQNRDGRIAREEIPTDSPVAAQFEQLDANKDGGLSKQEFAKHHEKM